MPLGVLAFFIQKQYQNSINSQIKDRLTIHVRELESLFSKDRDRMQEFLQATARDKSLIYYLSTLDPESLKGTLDNYISKYEQNFVKVYTHGGQVFSYYNNGYQNIHDELDLPFSFMEKLEEENSNYRAIFQKVGQVENILTLSIVQKVVGIQQKTVGYVETVLPIDVRLLAKMNALVGAEIVFFDSKGRVILGTLPQDISKLNLGKKFLTGQNALFEFQTEDIPYAFISTAMNWGNMQFLIGVGSSKAAAEMSIRKVNYMIVFTFVSFLIFLMVMSYYFLREVIYPIEDLIKASNQIQETIEPVYISNKSQTQIADLIDSFNEMSAKISESDKKMKKNVELLEKANNKIKRTQSQLVQSAKLASLGELVAGIAHELNNPIGFIYSNIGHLKEYSNDLFNIVDGATKNVEKFKSLKDDADYDYIKSDFPKLIRSCEEGANRAKDIVIGLRNFSRSDEESTQPFDVNAGMDSTLQLLAGEIKNKIEVHKDYGEVPILNCNINQMKQVFMNILSNACQAIHEKGEIFISTRYVQDEKVVRINIKDTGVGIDPDSIEKIFDPFYTTKEVGQGTGLGLSISYGIIKSHGGEISVDSELEKGTEFTINLPIYRE